MMDNIENKNVSQIVLAKIKEDGIKPISKKYFDFKKVIVWSSIGFLVLVGVISFSIIFSILFNNDWYLFDRLGFSFILKTFPYFWLASLFLLAILAKFYYRKTASGYRYRLTVVVGGYVLLTVIGGAILSVAGLGELIEESFSQNISVYRGVMFDKKEFWSHPEEGLVSGQVVLVSEDGDTIQLLDFNNNLWQVNIGETIIGKKVQIRKGEFLKILGELDGKGCINAEQIRPWGRNQINKDKDVGRMMR